MSHLLLCHVCGEHPQEYLSVLCFDCEQVEQRNEAARQQQKDRQRHANRQGLIERIENGSQAALKDAVLAILRGEV